VGEYDYLTDLKGLLQAEPLQAGHAVSTWQCGRAGKTSWLVYRAGAMEILEWAAWLLHSLG
jgi:hypothetical protein